MIIETSTDTANQMVRPFGQFSYVGVDYEPGESIDDLLHRANLDWDVRLTPVQYTVGGRLHEDKGKYVIYRLDRPYINFGVCGDRWSPTQNEVAIPAMVQFCSESNELTLQRVGSFKHGAKVWGVASSNKEFELPGGDKVAGNLLMVNHHTHNTGFHIKLLSWRQVCSNGMTIPVGIQERVIPHSVNLTKDKILYLLDKTFNCFSTYEENAKLLAKTNADLDVVYSFVIELYGIPKLLDVKSPRSTDLSKQPEKVSQILRLYLGEGMGSTLPSSNGTFWGLLNAITELENHHSRGKASLSEHIHSLWVDSKSRLMNRAYTGLTQMVGVRAR